MRLLLVEDDVLLAQGLVNALERMGYRVEHCVTASQARVAVGQGVFDCVLLDLGLPDGPAVPFIRQIRSAQNATPILVLTAFDHLETKLEALNAGADDYVLKPCDVREIEARIRVLLRRRGQMQSDVLVHGALSLDLQTWECRYAGASVSLTRREFLLLKEFLLHPGKILSRQHLDEINAGWQGETESNSVEVHIHNIRKKIARGLIRNVRGVGYLLSSPDEA